MTLARALEQSVHDTERRRVLRSAGQWSFTVCREASQITNFALSCDVARPSRPGSRLAVSILFKNTVARYLFAIAAVASTFALRLWLIPLTGTGAPFVLFFAAVLVTSLFAGIGPGVCALVASLPLAVYMFVTRAGYPPVQATVQALLFVIDGAIVIYLTFLMAKWRQAAEDANRQLRGANEEIARSMARTREVIELAPDAFFQADLTARFTNVNQAACRLLGYEGTSCSAKRSSTSSHRKTFPG
jgi:PAS domain-containing protein